MNNTLNYAIQIVKQNNYKFKNVLEFGVFKGGTIRQIRNSLPPDYKVFGFDTFEGLPEDWQFTECKKGDMSTNGVIPDVPDVTFFKGLFKDTIPEYKKVQEEQIALLHIDCDLYTSTIDVLFSLTDQIKSGTIIVFDEWYYNHKDIEINRQHEQKAFFEWANNKNVNFQILPELEDERRIVIIL